MRRVRVRPRLQQDLPEERKTQKIDACDGADAEGAVRAVEALEREREAQGKADRERACDAARVGAPQALVAADVDGEAEIAGLVAVGRDAEEQGAVGALVEDGGETEEAAEDDLGVGVCPDAKVEIHHGAGREGGSAFFPREAACACVGPGRGVRPRRPRQEDERSRENQHET